MTAIWPWVSWATAAAPVTEPSALPGSGGVLAMVLHSGGVVQGVLLLLLSFSVATWAIIALKWLQLKRADEEDQRFLEVFWESKKLDAIYEGTKPLLRS